MFLTCHRSTLRAALAFIIAGSLLVGSTVAVGSGVVSSVGVGGPTPEQRGKPRREKPEGELPDLEEVQQEAALEREAPAAVPSSVRSAKVPREPWNGRRVGGTEPQIRREPVLRAHVLRRFNSRRLKARFSSPPPLVLDDQFVQNFFSWTVSRAPSVLS